MGKELFSRYVWLLETIHRAGKITFEEINARWLRSELSGGETLSLRTFHHHRDAIEELFDINIECIKRGGYRGYRRIGKRLCAQVAVEFVCGRQPDS